MNEVWILLPETIPILRTRRRSSIEVDPETATLYFENFIYPLRAEYDVIVECEYGGNFGNGWKISSFPENLDSFPLTVKVYDEWGVLLSEKSCRIELIDKSFTANEYRLLCIGDSMTHRHGYVYHVANKLANVKMIGTRSFNGVIYHEGRGGWTLTRYMKQYADWWGGASPFVFPKQVAGKDYYGDMPYMERLKTPELDSYSLDGYTSEQISEGQIYHEGGKLMRIENGQAVCFDAAPEWEFDFGKYMERFKLEKPDCISILMGANDLQNTSYEDSDARVKQFMSELETMIKSIHEYDKSIEIVVNLPAPGAEQYAWGLRGNSSSKRYRLNLLKLTKALIDRWDGRQKEHVFVCAMRHFVDPVYGFDMGGERANSYSNCVTVHQNNWVHPSISGYDQMGDALAATVQKIRKQLNDLLA